MRVLALETTESIGSVAALKDGKLLSEKELRSTQRSAQSLAPAVQLLLKDVGWRPESVELVAVTTGPGSFTGLRVGLATAKVFAYAVKSKILGVDTLQVIAERAPKTVSEIAVAVDAQRGDVVAQSFQRGENGRFLAADDSRLIPFDTWFEGLTPGMTVSGPALRRSGGQIPEGFEVLPSELWAPTAAVVGQLAAEQYDAGRRDEVIQLVPTYSRRSAAEEKWEAKRKRSDAGNR